MNNSINELLGPLEGATRSGNWEDVEDIAREISRLARLQRLGELQKIQEALGSSRRGRERKPYPDHPSIAPRGSQGAKTPLPVDSLTPIRPERRQIIQSFKRYSASELLENLKDPAWTAKAKAAGWDVEELRKVVTEAISEASRAPIKQGESTTLPTKKEWEAFGFSVPPDLCLEIQDAPPEQWPFG